MSALRPIALSPGRLPSMTPTTPVPARPLSTAMPKALQLVGNHLRSAMFFKRGLGMRVNITPPFGHLIMQINNLRKDLHRAGIPIF